MTRTELAARLREWLDVPKSGKWPTRSLDDDLRAAAEALEAQPEGWISVKDRLPGERVRVFAASQENFWAVGVAVLEPDGWNWKWPNIVSHWMPLPAAPAAGVNCASTTAA